MLGVRVEMPTNQPIVLLRERDGERYLPIWIGAAEATAIAYAQQGVAPPRPVTHDFPKNALAAPAPHPRDARHPAVTARAACSRRPPGGHAVP